ncbi:N-acetylglucosaminyl transferase component [Tanacetum coccineum]
MPTSLQNRCGLSLLGYCSTDSSSNGELHLHREAVKENSQISSLSSDLGQHIEDDISKDRNGQRICGCHKVHGLLEYHRRCTDTDPIQLVYGSYISPNRKFGWIPNLYHIHWDGQVVSHIDLHIVIYGTPRFGRHHFSLGPPNSSKHAKTFLRKPKWVDDLGQKKSVLDLDAVILAINCAAAATSFFEEQVSHKRPTLWFQCVSMFILWYASVGLACVASDCSFTPGGTYDFEVVKSCTGQSFFTIMIPGLEASRARDYAEKASVCKHSMWLSVVIDVLLGNLFGLALLNNVDSVCSWIFTITSDITNNWWLISCARLMGNPAGFKLNTELAGVLGTLSLNSIIISFGLRVSCGCLAPLCIQATTALWRLFRGQKWNPLRERLDSYDYTVEQHIVGSLLFTPLLLLLPTTSAFYMSFTIMNMTIAFICMIIEVAISVIHATPYTKIILWLLRPSRFPCGIWFEIFSVKTHATEAVQGSNDTPASRSDLLVSSLHSYSYNIGALVRPHFRYLSSAVPRSSIRSSVYRVFSGRSRSTDILNVDKGDINLKSINLVTLPNRIFLEFLATIQDQN